MLAEVLEQGSIRSGQRWLDGTAGGGGHTLALAEAVGPEGHVLAIDRDPRAIARLQQQVPDNVLLHQASYDHSAMLLDHYGWPPVDGALLDLGLSSDQLADPERGFSFQTTGQLDMRFNPEEGEPVWQWLRHVDEKTLADTIYQFGEERHSRRIARRIVEARRSAPIERADQLRDLVQRSVPRPRSRPAKSSYQRRSPTLDPATRTFQALRIAINNELDILERFLSRLPDLLAPDGIAVIISFHSLEDRIVKHAFRNQPLLEVLTKKPLQASEAEIAQNPRSRSAKMRVARRLPDDLANDEFAPPRNP